MHEMTLFSDQLRLSSADESKLQGRSGLTPIGATFSLNLRGKAPCSGWPGAHHQAAAAAEAGAQGSPFTRQTSQYAPFHVMHGADWQTYRKLCKVMSKRPAW